MFTLATFSWLFLFVQQFYALNTFSFDFLCKIFSNIIFKSKQINLQSRKCREKCNNHLSKSIVTYFLLFIIKCTYLLCLLLYFMFKMSYFCCSFTPRRTSTFAQPPVGAEVGDKTPQSEEHLRFLLVEEFYAIHYPRRQR